mmetsp:Transcript_22835/g.26289  ORF Transcript_22835/g.26289 Transcript_22835/m.26289 type:complete len:130 (-) Transcript_22835:82-471(-)
MTRNFASMMNAGNTQLPAIVVNFPAKGSLSGFPAQIALSYESKSQPKYGEALLIVSSSQQITAYFSFGESAFTLTKAFLHSLSEIDGFTGIYFLLPELFKDEANTTINQNMKYATPKKLTADTLSSTIL